MLDVKHRLVSASWAYLTTDAFEQSNPPSNTATTANTSTTIANQDNSEGVLGGSVAFTRPDEGENFVGGPSLTSAGAVGTLPRACRPVGLFAMDALGDVLSNTGALGAGKLTYYCGAGSVLGVNLYETHCYADGVLSDGTDTSADEEISYTSGMLLFASVNGYLTANPADAYEVVHGNATANADTSYATTATVVAVVLQAPTSSDATMVVQMKI